MLCATLRGRTRTCQVDAGGVSDIAVFDPYDLNFTQGPDVAGAKASYTAVALRETAAAPVLFLVSFEEEQAELKFTQTGTGSVSSYEHELDLTAGGLDQSLTNFLEAVDAAGHCCGLGFVVRLNSGKIFVLGERYVNGESIPRFKVKQDGSTGTSGTAFDTANAANLIFKGKYSRPLYEYTGEWSTIEALTVPAAP